MVPERRPGSDPDQLDLLHAALGAVQQVIAVGRMDGELPAALEQDPVLQALIRQLQVAEQFGEQLAAGELSAELPDGGVLAASLKSVQASLRHLVGQIEMVAGGDFRQRTDLTGDLATAFDRMTARIAETHRELSRREAELSRSNARLRQKIAEATLLGLAAAGIASAAELGPGLQEVCVLLADFLRVPQAGFALLDASRSSAEVLADYHPPNTPGARGSVIPVAGNPSMAHVLEHKTALAITDAQTDPLLAPIHGLMRQRQVRSILIVPVLVEGEVMGTLGFDSFEERVFAEPDVDLVQQVADQVGQMLARKQAEQAERAQRALAEALRDTAAALNRSLDLDQVLRQILANVGRVVPHDAASIALLDEQGGAHLIHSLAGSETELAAEPQPGYVSLAAAPHLRRMIETGQSILVPDTRHSTRWHIRPGTAWVCSYVGTPIGHQGEVVGLLNLNSGTPGFFTPVHAERLHVFADQAAIAIQNARLYDQARRARLAAEAANRAKSVFLANMSHELRSPLNAILGFSQLMAHDPHLSPGQQLNLETINRSGEHLLALVNDVLDLSRIEAGRIELQVEPFDLHRLLRDVADMFSSRAAAKGLYLDLEMAPDLPGHVVGDESKLHQVLGNLLSNAVKFTDKGGVTLRARRRDGPQMGSDDTTAALAFDVQDTGIGIAPGDLATIFEAFVQAGGGRVSGQGTGLGLAISREYVRMMGGDIQVDSQEGQGSCFRFAVRLDLLDEQRLPKAAQEPRRVTGLEPGQPVYRLLVAEDQEPSRRLLRQMLVPLGFEVREVTNGQEAVAAWQTWRPHLILMDIRMPVMDGRQASLQIKAAAGDRPPVIVALTASAFEEDRLSILDTGCDDFVRKPFREAELYDVLARRLGVRFVYQVDQAPGPVAAPAAPQVGALPPDWLAAMKQATRAGDMVHVAELLDDLRARDPGLAERLSRLADEFEYGTILLLLAPEEDRL